MHAPRKINQQGFTIVELMIALSILSTLLVMSTVAMINLGHLFSKGTNQANTQNTTRNILNDLASQIELGAANPQTVTPAPVVNPVGSVEAIAGGVSEKASSTEVICIGTQRYTFVLNHSLTNSDTDHGLWRDTMQDANSCLPVSNFSSQATPATPNGQPGASAAGSGSELLSPSMRLTDFSVTQAGGSPGAYTIKVTIAFGGSETDQPDQDLVSYSFAGDTTSCASITGSQFCATSSLTETVVQRLIHG